MLFSLPCVWFLCHCYFDAVFLIEKLPKGVADFFAGHAFDDGLEVGVYVYSVEEVVVDDVFPVVVHTLYLIVHFQLVGFHLVEVFLCGSFVRHLVKLLVDDGNEFFIFLRVGLESYTQHGFIIGMVL